MLRPISDHMICAHLDRETLARVLASRATTARDVNDAPRIELIEQADVTKPLMALVLKVGPGRVHPTTGRWEEPQVRPGDIVVMKGTTPRLELSYIAREIAGIAVSEAVAKAKTFSACWDSCEAVAEPS